MKKKCLSMLLCVCMVLGLMGCSSSSSSISSSSEETATETVEEVVEEDTISEAVEETSEIEATVKPTASGNQLYGEDDDPMPRSCLEYFKVWQAENCSDYDYGGNGWAIHSVTFLDSLDNMPADAVAIDSVYVWGVVYDGSVKTTLYEVYIAGEGGLDAPKNFNYWFEHLDSCVSINFNNCVYTGNVTGMYGLFCNCSKLTSLDLSSFDTSNNKDIGSMFASCHSLEEIDLNGWDISQVASAECTFAYCRSFTSLDLSSWEAANITNFYQMFVECARLESLDMSGVMISSDADYRCMLQYCSLLNQSNVSLGGIDVSDSTVWDALIGNY